LIVDVDYNIPELNSSAKIVISRLLESDPHDRASREEIKKMDYFKSVDWERIRESVPSFIPKPKDITDVAYFDRTIKVKLIHSKRVGA
jgi:serine/threonine protein kinase